MSTEMVVTTEKRFPATKERDAWIEEHEPKRTATPVPGVYDLPGDRVLVVQMETVWVLSPEGGTA